MCAMNSHTVKIVAGVGAVAALAYCLYFDRKRRCAPDFKAKLRERRRMAAKRAASKGPVLPDMTDQEAVQRFFLQEVQLGESSLSEGDIEAGVEHLSYAVAVCGHPHSILSVLQSTLPPQVYTLLLQNLDLTQKKIRDHTLSQVGSASSVSGPTNVSMRFEDVE